MSDRNLADEWRLEDEGKAQEQWKLQTTEQEHDEYWQLQDEQGKAMRPVPWQPVDYAREAAPGGNGGWILSSLVGIALIAVVGYAVWIGLNRFGLAPSLTVTPAQSEQAPTPTVADVQIAAVATTAPTVAPIAAATATALPPTPTVAPTPVIPTVAVQYVTITNTLGVNARAEPSTEGEVIRIAQFNEKFLIANEQPDGWLQIALPPNQLAWVRNDNAQRTTENLPLDQANQRRAEAGLPALSAPAASAVAAAAPISGTTAITPTAGLTVSTGLSATTALSAPVASGTALSVATGISATTQVTLPATPPATTTAPVVTEMTATITAEGGLNVRADPNPNGVKLTQLLATDPKTIAIARTDDSQWIQLRLADKRTGWASAQYITLSGNIQDLPTPAPLGDLEGSPTLSTTVSLTGSSPITTAGPITVSAQLTVTSISGAKGRATPNLAAPATKLLPYNTLLTPVARTTDNQWVQVQPATGDPLWVPAEAVTLNVKLESLPVAQ